MPGSDISNGPSRSGVSDLESWVDGRYQARGVKRKASRCIKHIAKFQDDFLDWFWGFMSPFDGITVVSYAIHLAVMV